MFGFNEIFHRNKFNGQNNIRQFRFPWILFPSSNIYYALKWYKRIYISIYFISKKKKQIFDFHFIQMDKEWGMKHKRLNVPNFFPKDSSLLWKNCKKWISKWVKKALNTFRKQNVKIRLKQKFIRFRKEHVKLINKIDVE